jgi:1-acyl-sn-glycerol-3-phosphate acyltransferase
MKVIRAVHTLYALVIFTLLFIIFFPMFLIPILFKHQFQLVGIINRWWARCLFILCFLPFRVVYKSPLNRNTQYIFCPNHFSYADIPTMGLNHLNTIFVGKNDMENIPLFGFMYRQLHITVDRERLKSRYSTMLKTFDAIDEGKSLVIFPEGGIVTEKDPVLHRFKDGAFRASIEKQIPIVPVTIPFNWIILPPNEFLLRWKPIKVIFHDPIDPEGYTMETIDELKRRVRKVIEDELKQHLNNEDRPSAAG